MHCISHHDGRWWRHAPWAGRAGGMLAAGMLVLGGCASVPSAPSERVPPVALAAPAPAVRLPPPARSSNWDEYKEQAARRMVAAHPALSYMGTPPEPLMGIPVIEVELHADGSVRATRVVREPREAKETIQTAIAIVHRAAPYGDVSQLPKPWKFVEVFLFDYEGRFKPATLDR
ncbi:MAG: hypothetical protein Q8K96_14075 [Rubrivivax sp.]|nr:hypothetical protein [Rubrivivax sp.]